MFTSFQKNKKRLRFQAIVLSLIFALLIEPAMGPGTGDAQTLVQVPRLNVSHSIDIQSKIFLRETERITAHVL